MWLNLTDILMIGLLYAAGVALIAVIAFWGGRTCWRDDEKED